MRLISHAEITGALRALGIKKGDILHIQSDLRCIGPAEAPLTKEGQCAFYVKAFMDVLGKDGTITCCTAFEDYGHFGTPFILEESPSRTDMLSEFLRTRPGAIRSMHPIVSITGLGQNAETICGGNHYDGFGYDSPWARLHRAGAKILTLGMGANSGGTTFFHYVERLYGVPYIYTKIFEAPVFAHGRQLPGPFTMSVRYLDFGIVNTPVKVKNSMIKCKLALEVKTGRAFSWCAKTNDIVNHMVELLNKDRWIMLEKKPNFRAGEIPMDGITKKTKV